MNYVNETFDKLHESKKQTTEVFYNTLKLFWPSIERVNSPVFVYSSGFNTKRIVLTCEILKVKSLIDLENFMNLHDDKLIFLYSVENVDYMVYDVKLAKISKDEV